ncbi:MAG TPA: hypothetical protein PLW93_01330 [Candidatus Absconditabacterales bacterium]|nr:hypothetical protein [Candidatus Absconditabacterales bacterium]
MSGATLPQSSSGGLPMPKVRLQHGTQAQPFAVVDWYKYGGNATGGQYKLFNYPEVITMDLTDEQIAKGVWVEMLVYNRGKSQYPDGNNDSGYKIPVSHIGGVNTLGNLDTRGGTQTFIGAGPLAVDRPNHYKVTDRNQVIPVWEYLHNRMSQVGIAYNDATTGSTNYAGCLTVSQGMRNSGSNLPNNRFGYSTRYRPLYFKFRYIMLADDGYSYISGPLTPTIKLAQKEHPFDYNAVKSTQYGYTVNDLNIGASPDEAQCWFETRLP